MTTGRGLRMLTAAEPGRLRDRLRDLSLSARIHQRYPIIEDLRAGHSPRPPSPSATCVPSLAATEIVLNSLPFPIAFSYSLIGAGRDPATRYERLLRCYETAVRFCAAIQISDYRRQG
ncbi:MAG: hypothetical protein ACT4OZ_00770 [Gemmatimonadota bacterium]